MNQSQWCDAPGVCVCVCVRPPHSMEEGLERKGKMASLSLGATMGPTQSPMAGERRGGRHGWVDAL
jgi:hypothetical protein